MTTSHGNIQERSCVPLISGVSDWPHLLGLAVPPAGAGVRSYLPCHQAVAFSHLDSLKRAALCSLNLPFFSSWVFVNFCLFVFIELEKLPVVAAVEMKEDWFFPAGLHPSPFVDTWRAGYSPLSSALRAQTSIMCSVHSQTFLGIFLTMDFVCIPLSL